MTVKKSMTQRPSQSIKMIDLAQLAGVSKSTVSRALADSSLIPAATKDRIQALAREHNYRLNKRASNFRTKEALTTAVLIPDTQEKQWRLSDPFFLELLGSIAETLNEKGHELLLAKAQVSTKEWVLNHYERGSCDGVILVGQGTQHDEINELIAAHVPLVVWGGEIDGQKYCTVGSDNRLGGEQATRHLIEKGCRHIAFLGDRRLPEVALRYQGFCGVFEALGSAVEPALCKDTAFAGPAAHASMIELLESGQTIDGVVACSDVIAMGAVRALNEKGVRVPDDVLVVGYDDIAMSVYANPPLTTVKQDCIKGGQALVERLLAIIAGENPASLVLETPLIIRESSTRA
jgi:DNA-binding LacI/PurR family transcriptional regulator